MADKGTHKVSGYIRNRNGRPEQVRETTRKNKGGKSNNKMQGDLNPLAKAIVGGLLLFCLAQAGFGWIGDTIQEVKGTVEDVQAVGELVDNIGKTDNNTTASSNENLNEQGFTVEFDINNIEASDVQELLQYIHDNIYADIEIQADSDNIIYLSEKVLESSANYESAVINRLSYLTEPVIFIITYSNISESDKNTIYENAKNIVQANNSLNNSIFTNVKLDALYGAPSDKDLTIIIKFSTY